MVDLVAADYTGAPNYRWDNRATSGGCPSVSVVPIAGRMKGFQQKGKG